MKLSKTITLVILLALSTGAGVFMARDQILNSLIRSRLAKLENKLGEPIRFQSATLRSLNRVSLSSVQLGADRWVHIQRVDITFKSENLLSSILSGSRPEIQWVYVMQPSLLVKGESYKTVAKVQQQRWSKLLRRLKRNKNKRLRSTKSQQTPLDTVKKTWLANLPHVEVSGAKVSGAQGLIFIHQGNFSFRDGTLKGNWRAEAPKTGYCTIEGSLDHAKLNCRDHFRVPLGKRFEIAGKQLEWWGSNKAIISLKGLHLSEIKGGQKTLPFSKLKLDLKAGLKANSQGQFPLETAIVFPGGGRLVANGYASLSELELKTQVSGFPMYTLAADQSGTLNANARVWARWKDGAATFEGQLGLKNAIIRHPKLADGPVGPFNFSADGMARLAWIPRNPKRFKISVHQAKAQLGEIEGTFSATWDQFNMLPYMKADFNIPSIQGSAFAHSIPEGLMPHLQPIKLGGKLGFGGNLEIDFANLDKTKLKFKPKLRRLKVKSYNEMIDFDALKGSFDTRFEMPDGEIFTRVAGPETERWVELDEMPKLLPLAVISQEDGGFYKHHGISQFHLRGSLVSNLKKGRFVRGGSTLTMQLIKNLYLHRKKTLSRKLEELCLAWFIEKKLSKDELITLYLNIVEFGTDIFGIKEAAKHYFNKAPIDLRPEEISALTRLLPGPRLYGPFFEKKKLSRAYTSRVNRLLKLLQKRKHLKSDEWSPITRTSLWELKPEPSNTFLGEPSDDEVNEQNPSEDQEPSDSKVNTGSQTGSDNDFAPRPQELADPF